jgi:hypothetical protein
MAGRCKEESTADNGLEMGTKGSRYGRMGVRN